MGGFHSVDHTGTSTRVPQTPQDGESGREMEKDSGKTVGRLESCDGAGIK